MIPEKEEAKLSEDTADSRAKLNEDMVDSQDTPIES